MVAVAMSTTKNKWEVFAEVTHFKDTPSGKLPKGIQYVNTDTGVAVQMSEKTEDGKMTRITMSISPQELAFLALKLFHRSA